MNAVQVRCNAIEQPKHTISSLKNLLLKDANVLSKLLSIFFAVAMTTAASAQAVYVLIPPKPMSELECWDKQFKKFDTIVGYSNLGHFFMHASKRNEYAVLHPFKKAAKSYGVFASTAAFEKDLLKDPGFAEYVLRPEHVALVKKRVGALKSGEIYIPAPYPFLGGSEKPETYSKGDVWVFMNIVAQMHGLCH
jgi:hypothetical protein